MTPTDTTVLTVAPLGGADMSNWCGGWAKRNGRVPVEVPSAANLEAGTISEAADNLQAMVGNALTNPDACVAILAHSQGCQVVGEVLRRWLANPRIAPDQRLTQIVLTGNLERPRVGYFARRPFWMGRRRITPEDTPWNILDIGRRGDLWANFPGGITALKDLAFCMPHLNYMMVDPDNPTIMSHSQVGKSVYLVVP